MGRFSFRPRLWHHNDNSLIGTLEGMPGPGQETLASANLTQGVRPNLHRTEREQEQCVAIMLAALSHFTSISRSVVRRWCERQPQGTRCSLNTVFDLVCANHCAEVPDRYYETLGDMDNSALDLVILSCSEIAGLYNKTAIQIHSKVDSWLDGNTVATGARSGRSDTPPQQRVWVAHTTVRRKDTSLAEGSCKWVLPEAPRSSNVSEDAEGEGHLASSSDTPSTTSASAESSSQTPCRLQAFYNSSDIETLDPHPGVTPDEELRQIWARPRVKQGFWPEVGESEDSGGCICWRCFTGCRMEIPLHVMGPVWASEWERAIIGNKYRERVKNTWGENGARDLEDMEEEEAYNEKDFEHLTVYNATSGTHVLTIHPEMGLTHVHTQLEYPTGAPSGEVHTTFTGYFMALTPAGGGNEEEHAIEGLKVEWGADIVTTVKALVRNPRLRYKGSKLGARQTYTAKGGNRVYRHQLESRGGEAPYHDDPRSPGTPRPAASARTVARVRHKDVATRAVKAVNQTVTRDVLRMLNMLGATKKFDAYNRNYGVFKLSQLDPQPHIGDGTVTGTRWAHNHQVKTQWNATPSVSTQTPAEVNPDNPSPGKQSWKHQMGKTLRQHELKREPKTYRQRHEARLLRRGVTVSPSTRKYISQLDQRQAEIDANQEQAETTPWAPPSSGYGTTGQVHRCSTCDLPGHRSSECAALQASRLLRDIGPPLTVFRTAHLAMRYSEPNTPLWELTVKRRKAVAIAEVEDPPKISGDPFAPQWAPVTNRPSILTRLSGNKAGNHLPEAEENITSFIIQATTNLLYEPSDDDQTVIPERTTDAPVSTMSGEWEQTVTPWEALLGPTEGIDMQLEDGQYIDEEDRMAGYVSGEGDPDGEAPDCDFMEVETAGPQAAQSGVIGPAYNN